MTSLYKIVFDNHYFVIVDKSPLVLSVPSREGASESRPVLGQLLEKDLNCKIFPVHRLDYEVSGLIMYAKTPEAHKIANRWFETKEVHKTYLALSKQNDLNDVHHFSLNEKYFWKCKLLRGKKRAYESPHGKESLTEARVDFIDKEKGIFHWELNPITGRSHQLRFELFRHGHPIIGDELYSSTEHFHLRGIALRSYKIQFNQSSEAHKFHLPEIVELEKKF